MFTPEKMYMLSAIVAARESKAAGDYAVGAAIANDEGLIFATGNRTHLDQDATKHAEIIVIQAAAKILGRKNLSDCVVYSTHEPCPMCAGAMFWSRVGGLVYGASILDHRKFAAEHANEQWKWRTMSQSAKLILPEMWDKGLIVPRFMRRECLKLFHA